MSAVSHESIDFKPLQPADNMATATTTRGPHRKQRCRISFSCTNCRRGRQRCDRQSPCSSCIRRSKQSSCQYEEAVFDSKKSTLANSKNPSGAPGRYASIKPPIQRNITPSFGNFGYSEENPKNNIIGLFRKLEEFDPASNPLRKKRGNIAHITPVIQEKFVSLLRELPARPYVDYLVSIYFKEVQWQYSMLDYGFFSEQLQQFYESSFDIFAKGQNKLRSELFFFPALLFQVLSLALQFIPVGYDIMLDELCDGKTFEEISASYSDAGVAVSALFEKENVNLMSVQEGALRVSRMKNCGEIDGSWVVLGRAIVDAQEIGLDRDEMPYDVDSSNPEKAGNRLWEIEMGRRVMLNLYLWDSEMSLVLGKSMHFDMSQCTWKPPLDAHIPKDWRTAIPYPRSASDPPTTFTSRLIEYGLMKHIPEILELEVEGPYPKDYSRVLRLHQDAIEYMNNFPAIWSLKNPDKSFDADFHWLAPQREYVTSICLYFILALHKPYTFSIPQSRTEILKAGIAVLVSQQRNMGNLLPHQHKLFTLAFLTFECAVVMLAILIAYPEENEDLAGTAFALLKQSIERLQSLRLGKNVLSGPGADVMEVLLKRAEAVRVVSPQSQVSDLSTVSSLTTHESSPSVTSVLSGGPYGSNKGPHTGHSSTSSTTTAATQRSSFNDHLMSGITQPPPTSQQQTASASLVDQNYIDFNTLPLPPPPTTIPILPDTQFDPSSVAFPESDYGFLVEPLNPTSSLLYQDLAPTQVALGHSPDVVPAFARPPPGTEYTHDVRETLLAMYQEREMERQRQLDLQQGQGQGQGQQQLPDAFVGEFGENSFWSFLNQGM